MTNRIMTMFALSFLLGCNEPTKGDEASAEDIPTGDEDLSEDAIADSEDTAAGGAAGETGGVTVSPTGTWYSCGGTFTRTVDSFSWESVEPEPFTCRLSGGSSFEDGIIHLFPDDFDACEFPPWWVEIFDDEHPSFVPSVHGPRLSMLPTVPNEGARIFNLEEILDTETWALTDQAGNESAFRLCYTPDGSFFDGEYITLNESTDFLSYGGLVAQIVYSAEEEHWVTRCAGECPCGGVVTVEAQSEGNISGRYNGANCARHFDGTFSGILTE